MKLLLILLSVMTFTIQDKRNVSAEGTWPYDFEVSYYNTGNKGSVTSKDTATLSLTHLDGIAIDKVEVYVRSNKSSGAGTFTVTVNGQDVATKTGNYKDWFGDYNNSEYQALTLLDESVGGVDELGIQLVGSVNSIHIEKYVISWSTRTPRTVTLMKSSVVYATLTEDSGYSGVTLPTLADTANWHFVGWTPHEVWETFQPPQVYAANTVFMPEEDCTLWALYCYYLEPVETYMTDIASGRYLYVNRVADIALADVPDGGTMAYQTADAYNNQLYYYVDFVSPDTAYITHAFSLTPIGYAGTQLTVAASPWLVYHEGEETLFYIQSDSKTYVLWLDIVKGCARLMEGTIEGGSPMALMNEPASWGMPSYTCHPDAQDLEETAAESHTCTVPFGPYELIIRNGKKELRIR